MSSDSAMKRKQANLVSRITAAQVSKKRIPQRAGVVTQGVKAPSWRRRFP